MSRVKKTRSVENEETPESKGWGELLGVLILAIAILCAGGLFSYQFGDGNLMGQVGYLIAGALYAAFGFGAYVVTLGLGLIGVRSLSGRSIELRIQEALGFAGATLGGCILLYNAFPNYRVYGDTPGGVSGEILGEISLSLFGSAGTYLLGTTVICLGLLVSTPLNTRHVVDVARSAGWLISVSFVFVLKTLQNVWALTCKPFSLLRTHDLTPHSRSNVAVNRRKVHGDDLEENDGALEEWPEEDGDSIELESSKKSPKATRAKSKKKPKNCAVTKSTRNRSINGSSASLDENQTELGDVECTEEAPEIVIPEEGDESAVETKSRGAKKKTPPRPEELARKAAVPGQDNLNANSSSRSVGIYPVEYLKSSYELPPLQLFEAVEQTKVGVDREFVLEQAEQIVQALAHFKIRGKVTKVHPGPVITRYEFKPEAGVKLSRIENLESDLAMALEAVRIRILAPIPGKSTVGFEVPNKVRETVYLQENLADPSFAEGGASRLPLVLGKNITGKPVSVDLAKAPHLLVAGATGSGKSVGVNSMLCSLLYACSPDELRMILIDPKMLEFSIYADIPHLLLPVITDAEKANIALRWVVGEMERRYTVLSEARVRDIAGYNRKLPELQSVWEKDCKLQEAQAQWASEAVVVDGDEEAVAGKFLPGVEVDAKGQQQLTMGEGEQTLPPRPEKMPYVVVVIDEFADLMLVASKEVETNVARIAAKARAAGIHLIVATQRPSVDVITGTIKNNFPSRIAFQVTSDVDSRTILDQKGAKQLLGMGDMLYMDRGKEPVRVHGCFVSEQEIEKVVEFVKRQAKPSYNFDITRVIDGEEDSGEGLKPVDELYDRAVQIVAETQKVSTSMLQRRLNIGYNRAAKIVEAMEEQGVIGPARGSQPREVFISAA